MHERLSKQAADFQDAELLRLQLREQEANQVRASLEEDLQKTLGSLRKEDGEKMQAKTLEAEKRFKALEEKLFADAAVQKQEQERVLHDMRNEIETIHRESEKQESHLRVRIAELQRKIEADPHKEMRDILMLYNLHRKTVSKTKGERGE